MIMMDVPIATVGAYIVYVMEEQIAIAIEVTNVHILHVEVAEGAFLTN